MRIRIALLGLLASMAFETTAQAQARLPELTKITEAVAAGAKMVTGKEITEAFTGNTVYYVFLTQLLGMPRGSLNPVFHRDSRTRVQLWKGKPVERLWWMEGDALCSESADHANRTCAVFLDLNGARFSCNRDENICRAMIRVVPGNPEGW